MDLKITNTSKDRPVFRFGRRFDPEKTADFGDATPQQYLALRAVRALKIEVVQPAVKVSAKAKDNPGAKPAAKKSDAPATGSAAAPATGDATGGDAGSGEPSGNLADMDYKELQELAKAMELKYVGVSKDDLVAAIEEARRQSALESK